MYEAGCHAGGPCRRLATDLPSILFEPSVLTLHIEFTSRAGQLGLHGCSFRRVHYFKQKEFQ